ncbi:MAG: virulence-associated protein E, partial [Betaproteobacteria bacterium]|nr:virulence-associated protein E [Betaproteobacteria bacterium]
ETIAKALGGRRYGTQWQVRCPSHQDRRPSLSIKDSERGLVVYCHARCTQQSVITALKSLGLWQSTAKFENTRLGSRVSDKKFDPTGANRTASALKIWNESKPSKGTLVEVYLESRGIRLDEDQALRFHPCLRHPSGNSLAAMVALVTDGVTNRAMGIHRTYLANNGSGKAPIDQTKLMLGPCRGGAVRFGKDNDEVIVGEGIETVLSVRQAMKMPARAALSAAGLVALEFPPEVRKIVIAADGDSAGCKAANDAAKKWSGNGRSVVIAQPPRGLDFNDLLTSIADCSEDS